MYDWVSDGKAHEGAFTEAVNLHAGCGLIVWKPDFAEAEAVRAWHIAGEAGVGDSLMMDIPRCCGYCNLRRLMVLVVTAASWTLSHKRSWVWWHVNGVDPSSCRRCIYRWSRDGSVDARMVQENAVQM